MQQQLQQQPIIQQFDEDILVIPRSIAFQNIPAWHGIISTTSDYQKTTSVINLFETYAINIKNHAIYMPRAHAETNSAYKQIIPYLLFTYDQKLFVMQRKNTASEQRLANQFSVGIGGHIRKEDIVDNNIMSWAYREFQEEITYHGTMENLPLGVLNDDTSDVGKVHLGMIILIKGNSDQINIKDEHKSGTLLTIEECKKLYSNMENWSKICFDFLMEHPELLS
jgi:predicted NUDIX family phosphoesterase